MTEAARSKNSQRKARNLEAIFSRRGTDDGVCASVDYFSTWTNQEGLKNSREICVKQTNLNQAYRNV